MPLTIKILFCSVICTPMFMLLMGQFQMFSIDKLGVPGRRSYNLCVLLYLFLIIKDTKLEKDAMHWNRWRYASDVQFDFHLLKLMYIHFFSHSTMAVLGNPLTHISTGVHQTYGKRGEVRAFDMMNLEREEYISESGPHENSRYDYDLPNIEDDGKYDVAGRKIITPKVYTHDAEWYTVVGKAHKNRFVEISKVLGTATLGVYFFTKAFTNGYVNIYN